MRAAWGQSVQRLATRLKSFISPEGDEASAKPSGEGIGDAAKDFAGAETFEARDQVDQQQPECPEMTMAAQDADQASAELVKLRDYFQKVSSG